MTEQELQEIEALAAAATPSARWMKVKSQGVGIVLDVDTMPNAELIANCRPKVLALVTEVRRLRAALEEIREKVALVPEKYIPSPDIINFYEVQVIDAIERIAERVTARSTG